MSWLSDLFGGKKKKEETPNINDMIRAQPYTSMTEFPVGKSLNDVILAGLDKKGWGFPAEYLERTTSPFVAQLEADLPDKMRDVQDIYSSRGLGRSTPVARDLGEVRAQHGRDINQILSDAYWKDLLQKKADEEKYQNLALDYSGKEVATRSGSADFDLNKVLAQGKLDYLQNASDISTEKQDTKQTGQMIGIPIKLAASLLTQNPTFAASAAFDIADLLAEKKRRDEEAKPFL